jgi:hypothetical protein
VASFRVYSVLCLSESSEKSPRKILGYSVVGFKFETVTFGLRIYRLTAILTYSVCRSRTGPSLDGILLVLGLTNKVEEYKLHTGQPVVLTL